MKDEELNQFSKEELEKLKLREEIKTLGQPWWKKASYLGIMIPAILTLLTILTGIITGFIDLKKQEIGYESQIEELSKNYKKYKDSIRKRMEGIDYELQGKIEENKRLIVSIDSLNSSYTQQLDDYKKKTESLSREARNKEYLTHINAFINGNGVIWPL
ncbi:MAG: hypothetical protein AAF617_03110, partial [Bacteroidota bacterium]